MQIIYEKNAYKQQLKRRDLVSEGEVKKKNE